MNIFGGYILGYTSKNPIEYSNMAVEVFPAGTIIKLRGCSSGPPCLIAGG